MPKKKKKDKAAAAANAAPGDDPGAEASTASPATPAVGTGAGAAGLTGAGGFSSSLLSGGLGGSLNRPPGGASLLPPLKSPLKDLKEKDPNLGLLGNNEMAEMEQ